MGLLDKLKNIKDGWVAYLTNDPIAMRLAENRALICSICEKNVNSFCSKEKGGCGCYIPAKICCVKCECPDKKW